MEVSDLLTPVMGTSVDCASTPAATRAETAEMISVARILMIGSGTFVAEIQAMDLKICIEHQHMTSNAVMIVMIEGMKGLRRVSLTTYLVVRDVKNEKAVAKTIAK
jgi:hypothetical protein